jgi:hypothetical protein
MQEFLSKMIGRRMDVYCSGAASLRGELVKIEGGVLHMKDEEKQMCYVAIDKIIVVWEVREEESRPGFISSSSAGFTSGSRK